MTLQLKKLIVKHQGYLWVAPALLLVVLATIFPLFFSASYSVYSAKYFHMEKFVGLANYVNLFQEARFHIDVLNSIIFTFVGLAISMFCGFVLALAIRQPSRINSIYRTIILIPWVTNEVVLALMWKWILNPQMSIVYYWLKSLGFDVPNLLNTPTLALITITIINAWRSLGFPMVMIQAGLSAIPREVEEASVVDGASPFKRTIHITIPMLKSVILVMIIVITISFFNIISLILTMTGGGPGFSTELLSIRLYKESFKFFNINIASVLTTIILVINLIFVYAYKKLIKEEAYY